MTLLNSICQYGGYPSQVTWCPRLHRIFLSYTHVICFQRPQPLEKEKKSRGLHPENLRTQGPDPIFPFLYFIW